MTDSVNPLTGDGSTSLSSLLEITLLLTNVRSEWPWYYPLGLCNLFSFNCTGGPETSVYSAIQIQYIQGILKYQYSLNFGYTQVTIHYLSPRYLVPSYSPFDKPQIDYTSIFWTIKNRSSFNTDWTSLTITDDWSQETPPIY